MGLPSKCSLPILKYLVRSSRVARGKVELADDIRVRDGQCFLELLPLTHSVLASVSSMTCVSESISTNFITSLHSGAPRRPVPLFASSFGRPPTSHGLSW